MPSPQIYVRDLPFNHLGVSHRLRLPYLLRYSQPVKRRLGGGERTSTMHSLTPSMTSLPYYLDLCLYLSKMLPLPR